MILRILVLLNGLALTHFLFSQNTLTGNQNPWSFVDETMELQKRQDNKIIPEKYRTVQLDAELLSEILKPAPLWQTTEAEKNTVILALPMPDGSFESFRIVEAPVMHPDLAKKYPALKSYAGTGTQDPTAYLRFDLTPAGFHAMILSAKQGDVFIDPYSSGTSDFYLTYFKKDFKKESEWACLTEDVHPDTGKEPLPPLAKAGDCKLRTYRLALACTGEYAQFHGGTLASTLAAMHTTLTRVNGIYERDLSITLQLVANNDLLVHTNPNTDPYTNNNGFTMLSENIANCNAKIGTANYDIGHVFSTGGGGVAYLKSVCNNSFKAGGVTGLSAPVGDPFDVDYVCHEIGHQFGANHTQNNNCNRNDPTAVEPGSGSTIMGYAGVCAPNIQSHSDAYFHAASLHQIAAHVTGSGNTCASSSIVNQQPSAATGTNYTIPKSTYFVLTGIAADPNPDDGLTYCWEQMDSDAAAMPPQSTSTKGPLFRSLPPSASPSRYFPNLHAILNNQSPVWEKLPSVGRTMNFRLTVRDNHPGGGCTAETNVTVTVAGNAGPFKVTSPNTATDWAGGSSQAVTWDVAGSHAAPVNCSHVDILLSLDGGYTYPVVLAQATPNDGSHTVTVPNEQTSQARIMVRGTDNIFFDVSDQNFTITPTAQVSVAIVGKNITCAGGSDGAAIANASGGNGNFTYTWSNGSTGSTISNLTSGTYTVTVTSGGVTATASVSIAAPSPVSVTLGGTNATNGNNGTVTANATGGNGIFTYYWNNGNSGPTIGNLAPGTYTVTVTDTNGCSATAGIVLTGQPNLKFEHGTLSSVTHEWQTVTLQHHYNNMVAVASIVIESSTGPSFVTRIKNAAGNSFEIKIQEAGKEDLPAGPVRVFYIVAEEGVYTTAEHNVKFEARKFLSLQTSRSASWKYEKQTPEQTYIHPVVLGQVMTFNDHRWSAFWASRFGGRNQPPTSSSISVGKHIAEDVVNINRASETVGYFIFEAGEGLINGKKYMAKVGAKKVRGLNNSSYGYPYPVTGFDAVEALIVSSAGIKGSEGAWPVMKGVPAAGNVWLYAVEDQIKDHERSHTAEQMAYFAIGEGSLRPESPEGPQILAASKPDPAKYILAYPNPANSEVSLEFYQIENGAPHLLVFDLQGRLMFHEQLSDSNTGTRTVAVGIHHLPNGMYLFRLLDGGSVRSVKILKSAD